MNRTCNVRLVDNGSDITLSLPAHKLAGLPMPAEGSGSFIGWNRYAKLGYGTMSFIPSGDCELYAIRTDEPAYIISSHFRGDPENTDGPRCQFRRYVVDVELENSDARRGSLKLTVGGGILYYIGSVPVDGIELEVKDATERRGGAYCGAAYMTTSSLTLEWRSENSVKGRRLARLMLAFASWGMDYGEIERRSPDDIIAPELRFEHKAGDCRAYVSANFYGGVIPEEPQEMVADDPGVEQASSADKLPPKDMGELLCRYALLSDSHIGVRYEWENYDWLYGIYDRLKAIHAETPLDFIAELGDNIDDGYAKTYARDYGIYLDAVKRLSVCDPENPIEGRREGMLPHYELQGNHDTSFDTRFFRRKLWYTENSSRRKTAHIGFFTDYGGYPAVSYSVAGHYDTYRSYGILSDESVEFVEQSILEAKAAGAEVIVLYNHFGVARDLNAPILPETGLGKIELLCRKYDIRLYFSGHEHNPDYTLRKYGRLYDYDAAMTRDAFSIVSLYERGALVSILSTDTGLPLRVDRITY